MKKRLLTLLDEAEPLDWEESRRRQACVKGMNTHGDFCTVDESVTRETPSPTNTRPLDL